MKQINVIAAALVTSFAAQAAPHTPEPIDGITPVLGTVHATTWNGSSATEMLWNKRVGNDQTERVRATVTGCNEGFGTVVLRSSVSYDTLDWALKGGTRGDAVAAETCRYGFDLTEGSAKLNGEITSSNNLDGHL